jgi:hypothetical protein
MRRVQSITLAALVGLFLFLGVGRAQDSVNVRVLGRNYVQVTYAAEVAVSNGFAYVSGAQYGLLTFNVSRPDSIIRTAVANPPC